MALLLIGFMTPHSKIKTRRNVSHRYKKNQSRKVYETELRTHFPLNSISFPFHLVIYIHWIEMAHWIDCPLLQAG
jgi:hypothetical protein